MLTTSNSDFHQYDDILIESGFKMHAKTRNVILLFKYTVYIKICTFVFFCLYHSSWKTLKYCFTGIGTDTGHANSCFNIRSGNGLVLSNYYIARVECSSKFMSPFGVTKPDWVTSSHSAFKCFLVWDTLMVICRFITIFLLYSMSFNIFTKLFTYDTHEHFT